jgi:hypothetical protein
MVDKERMKNKDDIKSIITDQPSFAAKWRGEIVKKGSMGNYSLKFIERITKQNCQCENLDPVQRFLFFL